MACHALNIYVTAYGKMGSLIAKIASQKGHNLTKFIEEADVAVDFSHASKALENITLMSKLKIPLVIGTTGWDEDLDKAKNINEKNGGAIIYSPNFSLGVYYFLKMVENGAKLLESSREFDVRGIEMHHKEKKDAPSGTAKKMVSYFNKNVPITSVRNGTIVGKHTLVFDSSVDTITLTHEAQVRDGFANGAILAAEWIIGKKGWFTLDDLFGTLHSTCHTI